MIVLPLLLGGRFRIGARRPDGRLRPLAEWQPNLVLDTGLEEIAMTSTWLDCCQVGRNAVAPTPKQTTLVSPIAGTADRVNANSAAASTAPWRGFSQISWLFGVGEVVDEVREIGIGSSPVPGSPLYARAIVRNALGRPASVRALSDEALEVEYECGVTAPLADIVGTTEIDGTEHAYTARASQASTGSIWAPYRAGSFASAGQAVRVQFSDVAGAHGIAYSGALGAITSVPGGSSANCSGVSRYPYVSGSRQAAARLRWDLDDANFVGGIRSIAFRLSPGSGSGGNSLGAYQIELNPPAMKTADLGFHFDVGIRWGRP